MGNSVVGVDIGTGSLRAVEIDGARKGKPSVVRYMEVPVPEGAVKNGEVAEVNTVAAALKQMWSTGGFKSRKVVLGVGNPKVLVRDLTVPLRSRREILAALPFQVQDMLPVPVVDALLDFYPVKEGTSDSGPVVSGLLVAAVKEAVMANVTAVQRAGLTPVEVDLLPFALNRVLSRGSRSAGTVAMVDIGATATNVLVATDGVPQFVRIIPVGGSDVTRAIVGRLGVTPEVAEAGKRQIGLTVGSGAVGHEEIVDIIRELTNDLLNSLRNTLSFYINSRNGQQIDRVVLSGGGSNMPSFAAALGELTRLPVSQENPFDNVTVAKNADRSVAPADPGDLTVALGLALGSIA